VEDWKKIQFLHYPACEICFWPFEFEIKGKIICAACIKDPPRYFKSISVLKYDEFSKALITKFKYSDKTYIAKYFAGLMFNHVKEIIKDVDIIAPVPLHKFRLMRRKYNQAALIANHFAKLSGKKIINDLLIRSKNTKAQSGLNKKLRSKNIAGAFALNEKYLPEILGKNVLLIDDVITTGATIDACSKVLKKGKVERIYVVTLAKRVLE
jgi:ComF family protein